MVEVYGKKLESEENFLEKKEILLSLLPDSCKEPINRFKRVQGAQRSLLGELLSRKIISQKVQIPVKEISFKKTEKGKPYLELHEVEFNLSHSGDWVVFAISQKEVGIDVEKIKKINYRIAERFFSKDEFSVLNEKTGKEKQAYFFDLWTLKESYLKLIGTGLTRSLDSFSVIQSKNEFKLKEKSSDHPEQVNFIQYEIDRDYKLSVCSYEETFSKKTEILTINDFFSE